MNRHTFTEWLLGEVTAARCALLALYEQRDKLQYIDGPRLEKEYMEQIGSFEETVIKEEIECELLQKKQQMIQTAINRREPIDEAKIDALIETYRQQMHEEAAGPCAPREYAELSEKESDELQELYREIVQDFHPEMHPELTEAHRQLFQKAQEAYRRRDLAALQLVHEMLFSTAENGAALEALLELLLGNMKETVKEESVPQNREHVTDYSLAGEIYGFFRPTAKEAALREEQGRYRQRTDRVMTEMETMRMRFPYTAAEMLADSEKVEAYKMELEHRLHSAVQVRERKEKEIRAMIERVSVHG